MNDYDERIIQVKESLAQELNMNELTIITNKGVGLYIEIKTELFTQTLPLLRGEIDKQMVAELQSRREEMGLLLQKIAEEKIGEKFEKIFSEYLAEELENPCTQTLKKMLLKRKSDELKRLFMSIDNAL